MFRIVINNVTADNLPRASRLLLASELAQNYTFTTSPTVVIRSDYMPGELPSLRLLSRLQDDIQKAQPSQPCFISLELSPRSAGSLTA